MTQIFISHTEQDAVCAERLYQELEAKGYSAWRELKTVELNSILYPRTIENVILGSAAVVLVWSSNAAKDERVERHLLFAQRLKKLIVPVVIDGTALPNTLVSVTPITSQTACADVVAQLPPDFPQPTSTDPLILISEQAVHNFIYARKEAIDSAAEMLQRGEQREAVLALLEYLAREDLMMGVRDKAQEVLDAEQKKAPSSAPQGQSHDIFGVKCRNGHVSYFDKREVCGAHSLLPRDLTQSAGVELDELRLTCVYAGCGVETVARVDCRGYE